MKNRARLHFLDAVQGIKNQHPGLRFEGHVVCAVSGGVDSVSLLALVAELSGLLKITPIVAHLNHALRASADRDAEFVRQLATKLGLKFFTERLPQSPPGRNLEAWMREERYRFLERVRSETKAVLILTAHHAGDQEETLLMHLLTNRLPKGECIGIRSFDPPRHVFRPLLECPKGEILRFAEERSLEWVEDETNTDTTLLRNRVRLEILPYLRDQLNPALTDALSSLADRVSTDEQVIAVGMPDLEQLLEAAGDRDDRTRGLMLRELVRYPIAIRWRLLRDLLRRVSPEVADRVSFTRLFSVAEGLSKYPDKLVVFELGGGITLELVKGGVLKAQIDSR